MTDLTKYTKLLLKVLDPKMDAVRWMHTCYVPRDLYNQYMCEKGLKTTDMNGVIARWCKEDFLIDIPMSSTEDIHLLRGLVKDFYQRAHPDLFLDSKIDRQGWLRLWVSRKMREELKIYGN